MFKSKMRSAFAAAVLVMIVAIGAGAVGAADLPQPMPMPELERELGIMSHVIEESLNRSSLENWRWVGGFTSPFEPNVRYEYLPSVGAIFTISVSFPLVDHAGGAKPGEPGPQPEKQPDLWEKHQKDDGARPPWTSGDREFRLEGRESGGDDFSIGNIEEIVRRSIAEATKAVSDAVDDQNKNIKGLAEKLKGNQWRMRTPSPRPWGTPYDESKVRELRRVLVGALAQYGHRIEHLAAAEKIMIVAETSGRGGMGIVVAPEALHFSQDGTPSFAPIVTSLDPETPLPPNLSVAPEAPVPPPPGGEDTEKANPKPRSEKDAKLQAERDRERKMVESARAAARDKARHEITTKRTVIHGGRGGDRDHYLISIKKEAVSAPTTAEAIAARVEEYRY